MINTALDDLSAEIGFSATLTLVAWFGDQVSNVYVPMTVKEGQLLARLVGVSAARRLSARWGGEHLHVPSLNNFKELERHSFIARLLELAFSTREIAFRLNMSERRVQQICRDLEAQGLIPIVVPKKRGRPFREIPVESGEEITLEKVGHSFVEKAPPKNGGKKAPGKADASV